jgi:hypothetical protein
VEENVTATNGSHGIELDTRVSIIGNVAYDNGGDGISTPKVVGNASYSNIQYNSATSNDDDGLNDGAEVALGTLADDEDTDDDLTCDGPAQVGACDSAGPDNCPLVQNGSQTDTDGSLAGDACQCGDLDWDGDLDGDDLEIGRRQLVSATIAVPYYIKRCNVIGASDAGVSDCDVADMAILQRVIDGDLSALANVCDAYYNEPL